MPQQLITNGEDGLAVRNALNQMFAELYSSVISALKIPNQGASFTFQAPANSFIHDIFFAANAGTNPTVRIGDVPNGNKWTGEDVQPDATGSQATLNQYFPVITPIYFTIIGGSINIRVNLEANFY